MKLPIKPIVALPAVAVASVVGFLLRLWTLGSGPNYLGLYTPHSYVWCFLLILTFAVMAGVLALLLPLQRNGKYSDHFTPSIPGAAGQGLFAIACVMSGARLFAENAGIPGILALLFGIAAAVCLGIGALARFQGSRPAWWIYGVVCVFLAVRLFLCCRGWSTLTQAGTYLFPFAASAFAVLGMYQLCAFAAGMGRRQHSLFFSLVGMYLSIVAIPGADEPLFYTALALFCLTNLCRLRPLPTKQTPPAHQ